MCVVCMHACVCVCVCLCVCGCMDVLCVWHACVRVWLYGCVCGMHMCVCGCMDVCATCMYVRVYGCVVFSGTIKHLMKDVADPITTREGKSIFPVMKKLIQSTIPESELYIQNSKGGGRGGGGEERRGERRREGDWNRRRVCLPLRFWLKFHRSA